MPYTVKVYWNKKSNEPFIDNKYSRGHTWAFDGGIDVVASSSPHVVPVPMSEENAVDPEEAFIASLSSCHMLWFLSIAAEENLIVESYEDNAEGKLGKNTDKKIAMTKVTLKPKVVFSDSNISSPDQIDRLHELAHEKCFIANSVKTDIIITPILE